MMNAALSWWNKPDFNRPMVSCPVAAPRQVCMHFSDLIDAFRSDHIAIACDFIRDVSSWGDGSRGVR